MGKKIFTILRFKNMLSKPMVVLGVITSRMEIQPPKIMSISYSCGAGAEIVGLGLGEMLCAFI